MNDPTRPTLDMEKLEVSLDMLDLPARMAHWTMRKQVQTVRELLELDPGRLLKEKNLGRKSLLDTRSALERWLGVTWEQAQEILRPSASTDASADDVVVPGRRWQALGELTSAELAPLRLLSLDELTFGSRAKQFFASHHLQSIGDLMDLPDDAWASADNLARQSCRQIEETVRQELARLRAGAPSVSERMALQASLLDAWDMAVASLSPVERDIVTRRSGRQGDPCRLQELGDEMHVSRERVRQIEARALSSAVLAAVFARLLRRHLEAVAQGGAFWWTAIQGRPFWQPNDATLHVVHYLLDHDLVEPWRVQELEGERLFSSTTPSVMETSWHELEQHLQEHVYPVPWRQIRAEVMVAGDAMGVGVGRCWLELVSRSMHIDVPDGATEPMAVSFGEDRRAEVLAILRASLTPLHVDDLRARVGGRFKMPAEVMYLGRGQVGLEHHFPEMARWQKQLLPPCLRWLSEASGRQWSVFELHELLQESRKLPDWLTPWHLGSLLRRAPGIDYLGRLRVKLRGEETTDRLFFRDTLRLLLEQAGGPMTEEDLLARMDQQTGYREMTIQMTLLREPFVRVSETSWGLRDRDVPGGEEAMKQACERVAELLATTEEAMSPWEARVSVNRLSTVHSGWSQELVLSVLRVDERFAVGRGGTGVGLSCWQDGPRTLTRAQFLEKMTRAAGGTLPIEQAQSLLARKYGVTIPRHQLSSYLTNSSLRAEGDALRLPEISSLPGAS